MGRKPKTTGPTARDPGAFKSVLVRINADGWRAMKMLAVEQETTLNALAVEAFNDLLKKHGKRQNVEVRFWIKMCCLCANVAACPGK